MNELQIFENPEFGRIRSLSIDNEPWFVGKDVAELLGYAATRNALSQHVDAEDKLTHQISATGQKREMVLINESGLYSLILSSKLPAAKRFKRWVTSEVLPAIRKTGQYKAELSTADYLKAASIISRCKSEHLPYALKILEQAGFTKLETVKETNWYDVVKAMQQYPVRKLAKLLNLPISCVWGYRAGRVKPMPARQKLIAKILIP